MIRQTKHSFGDGFGEANPMTDMLFICVAYFAVMFLAASFHAKEPQEKALPDIQLSKVGESDSGRSANAELSISIKKTDSDVSMFLNEKAVDVQDLEAELNKYAGCARVAIRRDRTITTGLEDHVIAACAKAGIQNIALIVKHKEGTPHE